MQDATGNITNTYFGNNTVTTNGGAVFRGTSTGSITNCNFYGNKAASDGGAIYDSHVQVHNHKHYSSLPTQVSQDGVLYCHVIYGPFMAVGTMLNRCPIIDYEQDMKV